MQPTNFDPANYSVVKKSAFDVLMSRSHDRATPMTKKSFKPTHSKLTNKDSQQQVIMTNTGGVIEMKRPERANRNKLLKGKSGDQNQGGKVKSNHQRVYRKPSILKSSLVECDSDLNHQD